MPTTLADARAAVTTARRRLVAAAVADGAASGALYGAAAGVALALVGLAAPLVMPSALPPSPGLWLLALPCVAAAAGAAWTAGRAPSFVGAALALDRVAGTHEAFVSALSAEDAPPAFRELAAENALRHCPRSRVGRFLPLAWPRRARGAVVAVALLAAVAVLGGPPAGSASADTTRSFLTPLGTVMLARTLHPAIGDPPAGTPQDLRHADAERLRETAEALLSTVGYEEAERALAALEAGDRVTALLELERALERVSRAPTDGTGPAGDGSSEARKARGGGGADDSPAPWAAGTWPLRYDRVVGRWLEIERERSDTDEETK